MGRTAQLAGEFEKRRVRPIGLSTEMAEEHCVGIDDVKDTRHTYLKFPNSTRSFFEILLGVVALQTSDKFRSAAPADWELGKDLIIPPSIKMKRPQACPRRDDAARLSADLQRRTKTSNRNQEIDMLTTIERWLEPSIRVKALIDPLFRLLTSLIFVIGGLGHFRQHDTMLERMQESPWASTVSMIGDPSLLLWLSGIAFVVAGTTLALGWMTRASALILFATLIPVTIAIHVVPDASHIGPLFKNIAILGALLFFWARGPGAFALDNPRSQLGETP